MNENNNAGMRYRKSSWMIQALLVIATGAGAQTMNSGTKVQVLVNNSWKEAIVVKTVSGRITGYEVKLADAPAPKPGQAVATITVTSDKIRTVNEAPKQAIVQQENPAVETVTLHLGRYDLYSGIPSMNIGHFVLLADGKYKVAFSDDDNSAYENGTYLFHPDTNTIEWLSGLFHNNRWSGKLVAKGGGNFRIEFNKVTFGNSR